MYSHAYQWYMTQISLHQIGTIQQWRAQCYKKSHLRSYKSIIMDTLTMSLISQGCSFVILRFSLTEMWDTVKSFVEIEGASVTQAVHYWIQIQYLTTLRCRSYSLSLSQSNFDRSIPDCKSIIPRNCTKSGLSSTPWILKISMNAMHVRRKTML